jgi:hypothetical protein
VRKISIVEETRLTREDGGGEEKCGVYFLMEMEPRRARRDDALIAKNRDFDD